MKEMNSLEMRLRSWQPRAPSPGLRQRLFPRRAARPLSWGLVIRWAAPAVTCGLLLLALLNPGRQPAAPGQPLVALILSNQTLVAGLSNDLPAGQVGGSFGWTNSGSSTSSISSFSPLRAN